MKGAELDISQCRTMAPEAWYVARPVTLGHLCDCDFVTLVILMCVIMNTWIWH